eukprot:1157716-Pelagomonas_calceolata.AAC.2
MVWVREFCMAAAAAELAAQRCGPQNGMPRSQAKTADGGCFCHCCCCSCCCSFWSKTNALLRNQRLGLQLAPHKEQGLRTGGGIPECLGKIREQGPQGTQEWCSCPLTAL